MSITIQAPAPAPATATAGDPGEPALCIRCQGSGVVETCSFGVGVHEVVCPGVDDTYDCDGGFVR